MQRMWYLWTVVYPCGSPPAFILSYTRHTHMTHSPSTSPSPQNGYWAVFTPSISGSNLEFYPCPPGYCACTQYSDVGNTTCVYTYTNSNPDRQCVCDREGIHEIHRWPVIYIFDIKGLWSIFVNNNTFMYRECAEQSSLYSLPTCMTKSNLIC